MSLRETIEKALRGDPPQEPPEDQMAVDPLAGGEEFLGAPGGHIARGADFLETDAGHQGNAEEMERQIIESTTEHFHSLADIASLEQHPGFKAIQAKIDSMIETEREVQENAMETILSDPTAVLDPNKQAQNLYAINRLKKFRDWLKSQVSEYKEEVANRAEALKDTPIQ